jgi:hypothetical protein
VGSNPVLAPFCPLQRDPERYPVYYRKSDKDQSRGRNSDVPESFRVARILSVSSRSAGTSFKASSVTADDIRLKVALFYCPENTTCSVKEMREADYNLLYWSTDGQFNVFPELLVCGRGS